MLKIRLQRAGRRNLPDYRVVVAEHTAPVKGKFVAKLGYYNPNRATFVLDKQAALNWLDKGAKPSDRMARLMKHLGLEHNSITIHKRPARKPKKDLKQGLEKGPIIKTDKNQKIESSTDQSKTKKGLGGSEDAQVAEPSTTGASLDASTEEVKTQNETKANHNNTTN